MNMLTTYRRWKQYRRTVNELNALSPRDLSDVGIEPGQMRSVAWTRSAG